MAWKSDIVGPAMGQLAIPMTASVLDCLSQSNQTSPFMLPWVHVNESDLNGTLAPLPEH